MLSADQPARRKAAQTEPRRSSLDIMALSSKSLSSLRTEEPTSAAEPEWEGIRDCSSSTLDNQPVLFAAHHYRGEAELVLGTGHGSVLDRSLPAARWSSVQPVQVSSPLVLNLDAGLGPSLPATVCSSRFGFGHAMEVSEPSLLVGGGPPWLPTNEPRPQQLCLFDRFDAAASSPPRPELTIEEPGLLFGTSHAAPLTAVDPELDRIDSGLRGLQVPPPLCASTPANHPLDDERVESGVRFSLQRELVEEGFRLSDMPDAQGHAHEPSGELIMPSCVPRADPAAPAPTGAPATAEIDRPPFFAPAAADEGARHLNAEAFRLTGLPESFVDPRSDLLMPDRLPRAEPPAAAPVSAPAAAETDRPPSPCDTDGLQQYGSFIAEGDNTPDQRLPNFTDAAARPAAPARPMKPAPVTERVRPRLPLLRRAEWVLANARRRPITLRRPVTLLHPVAVRAPPGSPRGAACADEA